MVAVVTLRITKEQKDLRSNRSLDKMVNLLLMNSLTNWRSGTCRKPKLPKREKWRTIPKGPARPHGTRWSIICDISDMSNMFIVMNNLCSLSCPVSTLSTLSSSVCQKTHSRIIVYLNDKTNKVVTQRKQQDRMLKHKVDWPWTCCWSHMTKK